MNRRHFLATLGAAAAGLALDPERALWVPGQRTFVLPPANGWRQGPDLWMPALHKGDIFTIEGVYLTNHVTGEPTRHLEHFVVTDDVTPGVVEIAVAPIWPTPFREPVRTQLDRLVGRLRARPVGTVVNWRDA